MTVQPLVCCVNRGVGLEVEVTSKVLHIDREGNRLLALGVQLQEGSEEELGTLDLHTHSKSTHPDPSTLQLASTSLCSLLRRSALQ